MEPEDSPAATGSYSKVLQGRYELGRVLGRGGSSKVYRARDIRTGVPVAVKAVRKPHHPCSPEMAAAARRFVERELAALRRVQGHPHVMRLLDVLASRSTVYLVLELARGGSLLSVMDERGRFDEPTARRLFFQLVSALAHVHSRGVFHRDVKPENLLLDEHGDLKLTDFGLCTLADRHLGADGLADTRCGSPAYVAPEILFKKRYDAGKVTVWSSGVALFSLTAGYLPFNDGNLMGMYRKIFSGRFRCPRWFSPELRSLIGRMLDPDSGTRIKIREIKEHPWLQQDGTSSFGVIRAGSSDPSPEVMKWEAEMEQVRELNAFDIIALASGCDLSGLIGPLPDRVRFAVEGVDIGSVLDKAEEIGREEGFAVRRKEEVGCGGIMFEAMIGRDIVSLVRVSRFLKEMIMVEVERASSSSEPSKLWERLQLLGLKFSNY